MSRTRLTLAVLVVAALASLIIAASASAASAPTIESESASHIAATDATLEAQIDPGGLATSYQFEIAKSPACLPVKAPYMPCAHVEAGNLPQGSIPSSSEGQSVSLDLDSAGISLEPGATYHYRVVASNSSGEAEGQAQIFTMTSKPSIESESVSNITQTNATLEADINPGGLETHYQFRLAYGCGFPGEACPQFCISGQPCPGPWNSIITVPLPSADLSAATEVQHVSLDLNSAGVTLKPFKYRYSVEATNTEGTAQGAAQYFERAASPPPANLAPSIESESASNVTETDATLEAQINPQSTERGVHYQFQVVKDASEYLPEFACPTEGFPAGTSLCLGLPSQAGALPISGTAGGMQDQSVSLGLGSAGMTLQPGTTYHYRVIAARIVQTEDTIAWESPIVYGSDQTFTTPSASMPSIASESISRLTQTDATLEAQINTEGLETSYQFRLESGCLPPLACLAIVTYPLPSGTLLGSFIDQSVSLDLNSAGVVLHPDTKYRYSVDASNSAGTAEGSGQIFTTPSETGVEPLTEPGAAADPQTSMTTQSSPSTSLPHRRRHHRRHKRGLRSLGRASTAG